MESEPKKTSTINARIPPDLRGRITRIVNRHGTSDSAILEKLLTAFCDSVEEVDAVRWPAAVLLAEKTPMAAEDQKPYHGPVKVAVPPKPPDKSQRYRGDGPHRAIPKSA